MCFGFEILDLPENTNTHKTLAVMNAQPCIVLKPRKGKIYLMNKKITVLV